MSLYRCCSRWGLHSRHSRHAAGELLPRLSTLTSDMINLHQAVYLCCTFLEVTFTGSYPAPCPMEPGLSSYTAFRHVHATIWLTQIRILYINTLIPSRQVNLNGSTSTVLPIISICGNTSFNCLTNLE